LREELALIRERGYAINRGEYRGEIVGVAAPVRNHLGAVVASVSISGPSYRFGITRAKSFAPAIVAAALSISRKLGWAPQKAPVGGERARAS
jgi:DNA-binding IclR family transcriptional regulator